MEHALELSFLDKVRAWWVGEIISTAPEAQSHPAEPDPQSDPEDGGAKDQEPGGPAAEAERTPDRTRLRVAQEVWGEGYLGPGDDAYVIDLAKPLNPSSEHTILMLSSELGGPARSLAEKFGVWITAYESQALMDALGLDQSMLSGVARQVELALCDFETLELPPNKFASAFWKEGLFRVSDKAAILKQVYQSLKPGGSLLITDFVKSEPGPLPTDVADWAQSEPAEPVLWSADEAVDALKQLKFRVAVAEDISDTYQRIVIAAWKRWLVLLPQLREEGNLDPNFLNAMMSEVAYWVHRAQVLENGNLKVYRFLAHKSDGVLADEG